MLISTDASFTLPELSRPMQRAVYRSLESTLIRYREASPQLSQAVKELYYEAGEEGELADLPLHLIATVLSGHAKECSVVQTLLDNLLRDLELRSTYHRAYYRDPLYLEQPPRWRMTAVSELD